VDDFEDGDDQPLIPGAWYRFDDQSKGGGSTLTFSGATDGAIAMNGAGFQSERSLQIDHVFDQGTLSYLPFVGFGASLADPASPLDWSGYEGVSYSYRGAAHNVRVEIPEVKDYDVHGVSVPASDTWKTVVFPFRQFAQEGWGTKVPFDATRVTNLSFYLRGPDGGSGSLQIDDLKVVRTVPAVEPDMPVNPPAVPADEPAGSLVITNPLQAKAEAYLTRGYNITDWLESERFSGFVYDEDFVSRLALAGFKGLRLPIDLDRYVDSKTGTGASLAITLNSDLFTILDAFDAWTRDHGLSLTIDYHQYDGSLLQSEPDSLALAVLLWGKVAEHFASNPREDLFFELLNEPELSFGGSTKPTQAQWTTLAEQMTAAIRATDQTHTLIFGDVSWYGIDALASRAPLSDANVIYAFHDYDPYIFTHQGASWAGMGTTHDVPYPYSAERWSPYYADLGFSPQMEPWLLASAKSYYGTGNRSAIRNRILKAKRWAVTNNLPVICNEFGAYDGSSRLEDRQRYYTDVVSIFEELAIPWQHWFMVMDASGQVIPEYRAAMHLGL